MGVEMKNAAIAYALIWISVAFAISVAIYVTKSAIPLWALIFPGLISFGSGEDKEK